MGWPRIAIVEVVHHTTVRGGSSLNALKAFPLISFCASLRCALIACLLHAVCMSSLKAALLLWEEAAFSPLLKGAIFCAVGLD